MSDAAWTAGILARSIRSLRLRRGFTQAHLATLIGTTQAGIARLEDPAYRGWSFKTLVKLAYALRARLRVRFIVKRDRGDAR
jgi:transcriptional regulator with XRE-family HTH domain